MEKKLLVNSKVDLRFTVNSAQWLPEFVKKKLREQVFIIAIASSMRSKLINLILERQQDQ